MALAMARPWKHPNSGVYWLRRRVPDDLREVLGKREEKVSLRTRDIAEAKVRHVKVLADLDARWANLRKGPAELTERQAQETAGAVYDQMVQHYADNPSEVFWDCALGETLWQVPKFDMSRPLSSLLELAPGDVKRMQMENWCREQAEAAIQSHGYVVDERSRSRLEKAIGYAAQRASVTLGRYLVDGYEAQVTRPAAAKMRQVDSSNRPATKSLSMTNLVDGWLAERRPAPKTAYAWRRVAGRREHDGRRSHSLEGGPG